MLAQNITASQKAIIKPSNTAKAETQTLSLHPGSHPVQHSLRQGFKHEAATQGKMQIVEPHEHFTQPLGPHPIIQRL